MTSRSRVPLAMVAVAAAFLFVLNAAICRELFRIEYTQYMGSIEAAYIGISRYMMSQPSGLTWFPLWYGGIPFQNTYPPLLHMIVAAAAWLLNISPAHSHHAVTALFYCFGPVALFLLAWALSSDWKKSFAAGLIFSLISPSLFLMPSVHRDLGSYWLPRRLQALIVYGDGPHIASITLGILALLALHRASEKRGAPRVIVAAIAYGAVVLTNWLGAFSLAMATLSYLLARWFEGPVRRRAISTTLIASALGFGMILPWIPPSTISVIERNAQRVGSLYKMGPAQAAYGVLILAALLVLAVKVVRSSSSLCLRFSACFLFLTGAITLSSEWLHIYVLPQPERYHLEMEAAAALVLAFGLGPLLLRLAGKRTAWLVALLLVFGAVQTWTTRQYVRSNLHEIDIAQTVEYQVGTWLEQNLRGRRVLATGSVQYWLTAFSDSPEVGGGFGQGNTNAEIPVLTWGIPMTAGDGPETAMWVRLLGGQAVIVSGREGRDAYPGIWHDPKKFDGVLPKLWRNGDDVIYGVPQRSASLAHAVPMDDIVWQPPINVLDLKLARKLDAALQDPALPLTGFRWENDHTAHVSGSLRPEDDVWVQISYHRGWHAAANGHAQPIRRDGFDFMILEPHCNGPCEIELTYDGGAEMRLARATSLLSVLVAMIWIGWSLPISVRRAATGSMDSQENRQCDQGDHEKNLAKPVL